MGMTAYCLTMVIQNDADDANLSALQLLFIADLLSSTVVSTSEYRYQRNSQVSYCHRVDSDSEIQHTQNLVIGDVLFSKTVVQ